MWTFYIAIYNTGTFSKKTLQIKKKCAIMFGMCMGKINLKANLVSPDEILNIDVSGIKTSNKIVYKENNITVTILIQNNRITLLYLNYFQKAYSKKLLFHFELDIQYFFVFYLHDYSKFYHIFFYYLN